MAFRFAVFCDLLSSLESIACHDPPLIFSDIEDNSRREVVGWFRAHRRSIDALDTRSTVALLSSLLPERRTDRVYGIQTATLVRTLCRCLSLSSSNAKDLDAYKQPGSGDLADCLERVLQSGGPPALPVVTVEEVDDVLLHLAGQSLFSSLLIQRPPESSAVRFNSLGNLFRRLQPKEAKWLVRLILKDFAPVRLDESLVLKCMHFLLPDLLRFQQNFEAAIDSLKGPLKAYPSCPDPQSGSLLRKLVSTSLKPVIGVKVSRSEFVKARSVDHCLQLTAKRRWMVERKYDGEYCEIHVDLSKGDDWLRIFSKSGKDSTNGRRALRDTLRKCLQIGTDKCKFTDRCILLGEMVLFSDKDQQIMEFHKIRKHVSRSGVYLGTDLDSQAHEWEHLMIIFFDLLLLDANVVMHKPLEERKALLNGLYKKRQGRAMTAESKVLDFADPTSKRKLISHFAASIAARHEGLVLKCCGTPYFTLPGTSMESFHPVIKLKKDYIAGLGDEADLAVVGATYKAQEALKSSVRDVRFTHFHLGCLLNKTEVARFGSRPRFRVVGTIAQAHCIPNSILTESNHLARVLGEPYDSTLSPINFDLEVTHGLCMDVAFRDPFVFEVLGSSFSKPSGSAYWMLRFPRVRKLHKDRTWRDCVSFDELQKAAKQALSAPSDLESQETLRWIEKVERSCKRKVARMSCNTTPQSRTATSPPSSRSKSKKSPTSPFGVLGPLRLHDTTLRLVQRKHHSRMFDDGAIVQPLQDCGLLPTPPNSSPVPPDIMPTCRKRRRDEISSVADENDQNSSPKAKQLSHTAARLAGLPLELPDVLARRRQRPLEDVTSCPPQRLPPKSMRIPDDERFVARYTKPALGPQASEDTASTFQRHATNAIHTKSISAPEQTPKHETCGFRRHRSRLFRQPCALAEAVVYLDPSIVHDRSDLCSLVLKHGGAITESLSHWDRDAFAYPKLAETVSESQAYRDLQKMVLLDPSNHEVLEGTIMRAKALNGGAFRERLELYDYNMPERLCRLETSSNGDDLDRSTEAVLQECLIGVLAFDEEFGRSVFTAAHSLVD